MKSKAIRNGLILVGALAVLAMVALVSQLVAKPSKSQTSTPAMATTSVRSFPVIAAANGTLLPQSLEAVNFATGGQVANIDVKVGTHVVAGDLLAKLNDADQRATLDAWRSLLSSANAALSSAERGGSANAIANAKSQVANAAAQVQRAQAEDAKTVLLAPDAGTVLVVDAQDGDTVAAGTTGTTAVAGSSGAIMAPSSLTGKAVMIIGDGSSFQVSAAFSQTDITQLHVGQTGTMSFAALPGLTVPCRLVALSTIASIVDGVPVFYGAVAPDQTDPRLLSGMSAIVVINVAKATNVLAVPSQAVYLLDNASYVNVWYRGSAVQTPVAVGLIGTQLSQILSGLSQGEQVVLSAEQPVSSPLASPSPT
jgi:macrolide-specific efflux system membrane fusion protein